MIPKKFINLIQNSLKSVFPDKEVDVVFCVSVHGSNECSRINYDMHVFVDSIRIGGGSCYCAEDEPLTEEFFHSVLGQVLASVTRYDTLTKIKEERDKEYVRNLCGCTCDDFDVDLSDNRSITVKVNVEGPESKRKV